jgi:kynurenine formamidase
MSLLHEDSYQLYYLDALHLRLVGLDAVIVDHEVVVFAYVHREGVPVIVELDSSSLIARPAPVIAGVSWEIVGVEGIRARATSTVVGDGDTKGGCGSVGNEDHGDQIEFKICFLKLF